MYVLTKHDFGSEWRKRIGQSGSSGTKTDQAILMEQVRIKRFKINVKW